LCGLEKKKMDGNIYSKRKLGVVGCLLVFVLLVVMSFCLISLGGGWFGFGGEFIYFSQKPGRRERKREFRSADKNISNISNKNK